MNEPLRILFIQPTRKQNKRMSDNDVANNSDGRWVARYLKYNSMLMLQNEWSLDEGAGLPGIGGTRRQVRPMEEAFGDGPLVNHKIES